MSNTIPASVMDAMARAAAARVNLADRDEAMRHLTYHDRRADALWLLMHPADYGRVLEALHYWPAAS